MVDTALIPNNQNDTDDFAGALVNSTNLAIKGIIGIEAMSRVWSVLKDSSLASNYSVCITGLSPLAAAPHRADATCALPRSRSRQIM